MIFLNKIARVDNSHRLKLCMVVHFLIASAIIVTPVCASTQEVSAALSVTAVNDDATLRLSDGRSAKLNAIEIPDPQRAVSHIRQWIEGKSADLDAVDTDRYGRVQVYVSVAGRLLQDELLESGEAMVWSLREDDRVEALLKSEQIARKARKGMWRSNQWMISDKAAALSIGAVRIVTGTIYAVVIKGGQAYINFDENWKTDFSIYVSKKALRRLGKKNLQAMAGRKVSVRGLIHEYYGPSITLYDADMLETNAY